MKRRLTAAIICAVAIFSCAPGAAVGSSGALPRASARPTPAPELFANGAFVFLMNGNNPVDSLTVEQVRDIYTGRVTNWSALGGEDVNIVPFQRNPSAGSQTLMEKLVMVDTPMMEAPADGLKFYLTGRLIQWGGDTAVRVWGREGSLLYCRASYPNWSD